MVMPLPASFPVNPLAPTSAHGASSGAELVTADGRSLPLLASSLRAEAQGGLARFVLEQTFVNRHDETLHVTYRMPLPADGAVSGYGFELDGRTITGVIDRKATARTRFEQAIASGQTAALLEQERDDVFTQRLGNLPAGSRVVARIVVDQRLAWLPEGEWELRFPTVIGPRYVGTADSHDDARATHVKVAAADTGVRLHLALVIKDAIADGRQPSSPSHRLTRADDGGFALATGTRLDRDLVVRWPVATPAVGLALAVARPADAAAAYGLVSIVPPTPAASPAATPRDLLVLLDTSGSMGGGPLEKAKQVVGLLIDSLDAHDRLELIEFSNQPRRYLAEPVAATAAAKRAAIAWVRSRTADGGTEMRAAVVEALCTLRVGAQRQVVVVTDGYVGGEQQILAALHERLPASCRLHVLGVGSAVNRSLATALARAGRGVEVIVGIDEDAERGARRLLDRTRRPILTNLELAGTGLVRHVPAHVPDVFAGAPVLAALELSPDGGEVVVRGRLAGEVWEQRIAVPATGAGDGNPAIATLFGRERVADLETRALLEEVDPEIEALGLRFQIATRLTSWIAVDDSRRVAPGRPRHQVVPQELPYGTSVAAFGLRRGAVMSQMRTQAGLVEGWSPDDEDVGEAEETTGRARSYSVDFGDEDAFAGRAPLAEPTELRSVSGELAAPRQAAAPVAAGPMKTQAFMLDAPAAIAPDESTSSELRKERSIGRAVPAPIEDAPTGAVRLGPAARPRTRARWLALIAVLAALLALVLRWILR